MHWKRQKHLPSLKWQHHSFTGNAFPDPATGPRPVAKGMRIDDTSMKETTKEKTTEMRRMSHATAALRITNGNDRHGKTPDGDSLQPPMRRHTHREDTGPP
jgi:hypothetical protein